MARVARRVHDKQVLGLIRRYLEAGVMDGGLVAASEEGTPQGSPLSPLLSNVMLDDLDWELEKRGHRFVRFADDGRIYVHSRRAGERVMASITHYVEQRLKLKVNREKSVVDRATKRPLLGFRFAYRGDEVRVLVDPKRVKRAKDRLRQLTSRRWGVSMQRRIFEINRFTVGWTAYFALADTPSPFEGARQVAQTHGYGRSGGRSGSACAPSCARCERQASPSTTRADGRSRARDTGASRALRSFPPPYQTPTGPNSAWKGSSIPTAVSGMLSEPPGADPHAGWCGGRRGELGAYPIARTAIS